jgi:FlaA1/EpsC-like NDP-sugar epimerase
MEWRPIYTASVIPPLADINWHSFLARPPLPSPSQDILEALAGQSVLITGAGGSIGAALAHRVAALKPPNLLLLESSESNLYALASEFSPSPSVTFLLGNAADPALLEHIFAAHSPRFVFHAAAFKHVPLMEQHPLSAIANNIFATEAVTRAATAHHARVILLSTDKAVEPASVMGATKRVAEQIVLTAGGTVLRLGNVLATRDSVVEIFARQIAHGGPITVTDPAARRYFLTLDEAVDQLLLAAANQDRPILLAPDLRATHFIADLAKFMACTIVPQREIAIEFTQPRPGDKETEQLWSTTEFVRPFTSDSSTGELVSIQSSTLPPSQLTLALACLHAAVESRDIPAALTHLQSIVPDYTQGQSVQALACQTIPQVSQ